MVFSSKRTKNIEFALDIDEKISDVFLIVNWIEPTQNLINLIDIVLN